MMYGPINADMMHKKEVEQAGFEVCERCNGTGNEFYAMYRKCSECGGAGHHGKKKAAGVPLKA